MINAIIIAINTFISTTIIPSNITADTTLYTADSTILTADN